MPSRIPKRMPPPRTVFLGGEMFSLKHLAGNARLAEAIHAKSHGDFRCILPQDFSELRGRNTAAIRDFLLRALVRCDLALLHFDGTDLDSGTVVEFMMAKFADVPTVLLRTDFRGAGDEREAPWNVMAMHFPRTVSVVLPSLFAYRQALERRRGGRRAAGAPGSSPGTAAAEEVWSELAARCVRALRRAEGMKPVLPPELRRASYRWLALAPGLRGHVTRLQKEFEGYWQRKVERGLL